MSYTFPTKTMAYWVAGMLYSMTGDTTRVVAYNSNAWRVERFTGTAWVTA